MILDGALLFDSAHNISAATGTEASQNVLDLLNARDMGIGDDPSLKVLAQVTVAFASGTSIQCAFQGSTDNSTYTTYATGPVVATANLIAGARLLDIDVPRPAAGASLPRYLRLLYTTVGTFSTAGLITAGIVLDRQDVVNYPAGINISN